MDHDLLACLVVFSLVRARCQEKPGDHLEELWFGQCLQGCIEWFLHVARRADVGVRMDVRVEPEQLQGLAFSPRLAFGSLGQEIDRP